MSDKETKRICLQERDEDKITEYLEKGYDVIYPVFINDRYSSTYVVLVNSLNDKLEIAEQELDKYKNIIDEALGIANERINYYAHKQTEAEDWSEIFNVLIKRDNQELKGE